MESCWNRGQMCHSQEVGRRSDSQLDFNSFTLTSPRVFLRTSAFYLPSGYATLCRQCGVNQASRPNALTDKSGISLNIV